MPKRTEDREREKEGKEVADAAIAKLEAILGAPRQVPARGMEGSEDELAALVNKKIKDEVDRRVDAEFKRRVEARAQEEVKWLVEGERSTTGKALIEQNVAPMAQQLDQSFRINALSRLSVPWTLFCPEGHQHAHSFSSKEWDELVRTGHTRVPCAAAGCVHANVGAFSGIEVRSQDLIQALLLSSVGSQHGREPNSPVAY